MNRFALRSPSHLHSLLYSLLYSLLSSWLPPFVTGLVLVLLLAGAPARAFPLISELFYDGVGGDDGQSFVELYGTPGGSLDGLVLEGVNGSGGGVTVSIALSGVFPADGLFVLADVDGGGTTLVPGADGLADFDFQNGPDSVVLRDASRGAGRRGLRGLRRRRRLRRRGQPGGGSLGRQQHRPLVGGRGHGRQRGSTSRCSMSPHRGRPR